MPTIRASRMGVGDVALAARRGQGFQRCRGHERHHGHRTCGQLTAGAEQGGHHGRQERRIQAVIGRHSGKLGIGHGLGDEHEGHGQP